MAIQNILKKENISKPKVKIKKLKARINRKKRVIYGISGFLAFILLVTFIFNIFNNFKAIEINRAYQTGKIDAINQLVNRDELNKCQPFTVYNDGKKVQFINVECKE